MNAIEPVHAQLIPPRGDDGEPSEVIGNLPDGRAIYRRNILRAEKEKKPWLDNNGQQVFGKHPTTGEILYTKQRAVGKWRRQDFILDSDGHNNVYIQEWAPQTAAEAAAAKLAVRKAEVLDQLAERLAREEIGVDALEAVAGGDAPANLPDGFFPQHKGASNWVLSNGETFRGSKAKAQEAEAALHLPEGTVVIGPDGTAEIGGTL